MPTRSISRADGLAAESSKPTLGTLDALQGGLSAGNVLLDAMLTSDSTSLPFVAEMMAQHGGEDASGRQLVRDMRSMHKSLPRARIEEVMVELLTLGLPRAPPVKE